MAQDYAEAECPYCGAALTLSIDYSVSSQQYVEDCQNCCRPMLISVKLDTSGDAYVSLSAEGG